MLSRLVGFSLRNRLVVLALALALLLCGVFVAARSPMDVFPEFAPPQVGVETEALGLSAEEVEALVTFRLETAINGSPGLKILRSTSMPGVSGITAIFADDTDVYRDRQVVAERLETVVRDLPAVVTPPVLTPLTSASSTIEVLGVTSTGPFDPIAVRTFADWTLKPRLLSVPGVAKVVVYGGRVAQDQVIVNPSALRDYGLALRDVADAARNATSIGPAGTVEVHGQRFPIRSLGQAASVNDLESAVVAYRDGRPLTLDRIARVRLGPEFPIGDASLNGGPAVLLYVSRQPGVNTLDVTRQLDAAVAETARHMPPGLALYNRLFRQASFIERAVGNLRTTLLIGGALVAAVLLLFLLDLRTAAITLIAIPLSLLTAILVLRAFGATLNTMTLGGLAIALGEVVDDAIIDVENIHRRLRENRAAASPRPARDVIFDASLEVRSSVVYATFLVALVFLPVFFLSGIAGKIFSPLGQAYVLSTLASLGVAILVTPAACSVLLGGEGAQRKEGGFVALIKKRYRALLGGSLERPGLLAIAGAGLFVLSLAGLPFLAGEFLPAFQENNFIVHMVGLPGTALTESVDMGKKVEKRLLEVPGVVSVAQKAGRAELADEVAGVEASELDVQLSAAISRVTDKIDEVRQAVAGFPGFSFSVNQFLKERIEEVIGGETAPVVVSVSGPDLAVLRGKGLDIARTMESIPGARDIQVGVETNVPQIVIRFDREKASQVGATIDDLQQAVATAFEGTKVNEIFSGQQILPVIVKYPEESRGDLDAIRSLPIRAPAGSVPLGTLADVSVGQGPNAIARERGQRVLRVTCDVKGSVSRYAASLKRRLRSLALSPGYSVELSGDYAEQQRSLRELLLVGALALAGIYLLLLTDFRSGRLASLVLVNLPLALVGGIAAALLLRVPLSLGALVGFVTLFGITARNAIMLISHYRHLETREGVAFGPDLVVRGSLDRVSPVLMTALVTGLALLPLVIGGNRAGQEIEYPMAVVIVGGLLSSTALNLLLMPAFYLSVWSRRRREAV
jgi:CzcA family heavy metal efflux pump